MIKLSSKLDGISEFLIIVFASFATNFPQTTQEVSNICGTAPERPADLSTFILVNSYFYPLNCNLDAPTFKRISIQMINNLRKLFIKKRLEVLCSSSSLLFLDFRKHCLLKKSKAN